MKLVVLLIVLLQKVPCDGILNEIIDRPLPRQNSVSSFMETPGASWWWNVKLSQGDSVRGDSIYYPGQDIISRVTDGGYHNWWWRDIMLTFGDGNVIKSLYPSTTTATPTTTMTTTTPTPTTTTSSYPPWPRTCLRSDPDSLGPFYWPFVPFPERSRICSEKLIREYRLDVSGYVFRKPSSDCNSMVPQVNAKVEIWLANRTGDYEKACVGFVMTDSRGYYSFTSSMPGVYPGRPQHIHYQITTQDSYKLVTQMYFQSDAHRGRNPDLTVADPEISSKHRAAQFNIIM